MNSLSILSSQVDRVIGNTPPSTPRSDSAFKSDFFPPLEKGDHPDDSSSYASDQGAERRAKLDDSTEATALLPKSDSDPNGGGEGGSGDGEELDYGADFGLPVAGLFSTPFRRLWRTVRAAISWVVACFYDNDHRFSFLAPVQRIALFLVRPLNSRKYELSALQDSRTRMSGRLHQDASTLSSSILDEKADASSSSSLQPPPVDEIAPRRSIRIRLFSSDKQQQKAKSVKSPTSPSASLRLTRYPRLSGPPRPLLPKSPTQKTLILDLDETLIHSMSKGGSMSAAHMVEVKLDKQHAILYYVHKRPFCDEFLKKVCKWYNVVIFTASVQEYADPVIDWLDQEHKFFRARYYRQHCTYRDGVYIKDLSVVEPDLSKVMIVDNSPTSYIFHKDNAIPIEGWISDPSDHHLLHLIPILQGLQYVTDVRAFLALRMGEAVT
ncbi:Nuclear envelope morphology protein 1 [Orbilia brochopaga]|uniref:Nuclear envelope morphology protein 1 n=1 Tax=Orbilia brochopaga TaxID=3140254 RepID=A0AAV9UC64_9PEZI